VAGLNYTLLTQQNAHKAIKCLSGQWANGQWAALKCDHGDRASLTWLKMS